MVEKPTEADWILRAMVAVAAADGRLDAREVGLIQQVYEERTGRPVDVSGVASAAEVYATKRDILAELAAISGSMSRQTKEEIIRSAYLVLLADGRIAGEERSSTPGESGMDRLRRVPARSHACACRSATASPAR